MSRLLSELLGAAEPMFTGTIQQLERISGDPNIDVRLTAEIATKVRQKTRELGLDPADTTTKELYHALQGLVQIQDNFLVKALGGSDPTDVSDLLPRIIKKVESLPQSKRCWVLKHSVAKRLLKDMPPKQVMKQLGHRSIDSMLKRENIDELFVALQLAQSQAWLERFTASYKKLQPSDFEIRPISIVQFSPKRWKVLSKDFAIQNRHAITYVKELGIIAVLPIPVEHLRGICITLLPLLLHAMNEIRLYSAFFKLQQVKPDFAKIVITTLTSEPVGMVSLAGQPLHWRTIQRFYGRQSPSRHPEVFEPHVQPEDLQWQHAEELIYRIEPALKFWEGLDYVGAPNSGQPVSLNLLDNAISYCNDLPYGQQMVTHFQDSLWNEVFMRYMDNEPVEQQVLQQLDAAINVPEVSTVFGEF
ncbi:MAG TPA: hypothetical protein VLF90_03080 [Patescibacteria group bacterium]|nr:hypothetical protein [Patescibacteria group bacterium]